jgi:hypothetical protein
VWALQKLSGSIVGNRGGYLSFWRRFFAAEMSFSTVSTPWVIIAKSVHRETLWIGNMWSLRFKVCQGEGEEEREKERE